MFTLNTPNGAPEWMRVFVLQLNAVLRSITIPIAPTRLAAYVAGSGPSDPNRTLPNASDYPASVVWVCDGHSTASDPPAR